MLFAEACYLYVESKSEGRKKVRPNTLEGYLSAIRCHLMPMWSGREIESITADDVVVLRIRSQLARCDVVPDVDFP